MSMLLTVDLGNTSTKLGLFDNGKEVSFLCVDGLEDNFRSTFLSFIYKSNFDIIYFRIIIRY